MTSLVRFTSHISPLRAVKLIFKGVSLSVSPLLYEIMPKGLHLLSSEVANLRNVFFSLGEGEFNEMELGRENGTYYFFFLKKLQDFANGRETC